MLLAGGLLIPVDTMKIKAVAAIVAPVIAVGTPFFIPKLASVRSNLLDTRPASVVQADARKAGLDEPVVDQNLNIELAELQTAVDQGIIKASFVSNGRDVVRATITSRCRGNLKIQVEAGQMLEAGLNSVVVIRPASLSLEPGKPTNFTFQTAATRSGNKLIEQNYRLTYGRVARIDGLLAYTQSHPEMTPGSIQTAVLALTENLPLSSVSKFPTMGSEFKSRFNTDAFRVETSDLINALVALKEAGISEQAVALAVDPQLRVEAMIDPQCRPTAMHYYGITGNTEWEYWKTQLLEGDMSTRHYALYGIARFYPETAIEMLPKWARETRTTPVFRLAALQALAETHRPEALPILRQLAEELGPKTNLGRAAAGAAEFLETKLSEQAVRQPNVAFRSDGVKVTQN